MGRVSLMRVLNQKIENDNKLKFARNTLTKEQFMQLYTSYKQLYWFQMTPVIIFAIGTIFSMLFISSEEVPKGHADLKMTVLLCEAVVFIFCFIVWVLLSQFLVVGKLWRKYSR